MENSGFFPDDLLVQILVRLPPKSLLRFRCVSKSWHNLISSQDFVKMHLNRSLVDRKPLRLICEDRDDSYSYLAADFSKLENFADTIHRFHHPLKTKSTIIGSCNGLLCANWICYKGFFDDGFRYDESFLIFNPWTRKCQWISGETSVEPYGRSNFYGFGYDDVHDDYKVVTWNVRIPSFEYYPLRASKFIFEVYSVRNGSWSTRILGLDRMLDRSYMDDMSSGVLLNCVLHWMWKTWTNLSDSSCKYDIVAFDLRTEEHWLMETPYTGMAFNDSGGYRMDLGVLNGCLCGIVFAVEVPNKLDLWVMKVYGIKDSWIKMTIDMSSLVQITGDLYDKLVTPIVPLVHVENKKQMMLYSYEEGFLLADMVTNKLSKVIKFPELGREWRRERIRKLSFVPKEFCFRGSLVELPAFCSFDSFDKKRRRMQHKAERRRMQEEAKRRRMLDRRPGF